jgi:hypothetical protein
MLRATAIADTSVAVGRTPKRKVYASNGPFNPKAHGAKKNNDRLDYVLDEDVERDLSDSVKRKQRRASGRSPDRRSAHDSWLRFGSLITSRAASSTRNSPWAVSLSLIL